MSTAPEQTTSGQRRSLLAWPWFPFIAAIYPLWFIYSHNIGQISVGSVAATTLVALTIVAILYWAGVRWGRSRSLAALAVTVLIAAFYLYGPLHSRIELLAAQTGGASLLARFANLLANHALFSALVLATTALLIWRMARRPKTESAHLIGACNLAAAILALLLLWRIGSAVSDPRALAASANTSGEETGRSTSVLGYNPDIYYIILDGYARADVLRDH